LTTGAWPCWSVLHLAAGAAPDVYEFGTGPDVSVVDSQTMVMKRIHLTVR